MSLKAKAFYERLQGLEPQSDLDVERLDEMADNLLDLLRMLDEVNRRGVYLSLRCDPNVALSATTAASALLRFAERNGVGEVRRRLPTSKSAGTEKRARGRQGGRRPAVTREQLERAAELMADPAMAIADISAAVGMSRSSLYRYLTPDGALRPAAKAILNALHDAPA